MYTHLAHLYDWTGSLDFAQQLVEKTGDLLDDYNMPETSCILDLACGTGEVAVSLAEDGYDVIGLDISDAMLAEGQKKQTEANNNQLKLQWLNANITNFELKHPVDLVICYNDSINHLLTENDVKNCFNAVYQALTVKGHFWFDTNTLENYQQLWQGKDIDELENGRLIFNSAFNTQTQRAQCTVQWEGYENLNNQSTETNVNDDTFNADLSIKKDEVNAQYYSNETIEQLLKKAGFTKIESEPFNPYNLLPDDQPIKTFWLVQK